MLLGDHFPDQSIAQMTLQGSLQLNEPEFYRGSGVEQGVGGKQIKKEDTGQTGLHWLSKAYHTANFFLLLFFFIDITTTCRPHGISVLEVGISVLASNFLKTVKTLQELYFPRG